MISVVNVVNLDRNPNIISFYYVMVNLDIYKKLRFEQLNYQVKNYLIFRCFELMFL
jgi:hypothetical protein